MDTTKEFDGLAAVYTIGRPAYANAFINELYNKYGVSSDTIIADIGSGTGKFAKQLIERGTFVYCIEPNDDMRNQSIIELQEYRNCKCVAGNAANTSLQDNSVDFITAAQAFHWFDVELFRNECKRIIRPCGKVFLIWNIRDITSEITQKSYQIYQKYCPDFKGFNGGIKKDDTRIKHFFNNQYERIEYDNPLYYDKNKFINRSLSSSYSLKKEAKDYNNYIKELENLYHEYANEGILSMPNKTVVYIGSAK